MVLTAFFGAGSASATVLCKTTMTSECAIASWTHATGTTLHAVLDPGAHATLNAVWTDVTCKKSTIHAKTDNQGSATETVRALIESLTFEECECTGAGAGTALPTVLAKGELEIHYISGTHTATVTSIGTKVTFNCTPLGTQCIFGTKAEGTDVGTLTSGNPATVDEAGTVNWSSGTNDEGSFLCGSTAKWEGTYEITEPKPLYVATS